MSRKKSKYTRDDRKHIVTLIENLKNDDDYVAIFEILTDDPSNICTRNSNGVFINLSVVNDNTLNKITKYLTKTHNKKMTEIEVDTDTIPNIVYPHKNRTYKLSNYEQNIIKQRNLKKVMNNENEYEELKFSAKKKNSKVNKKIEI